MGVITLTVDDALELEFFKQAKDKGLSPSQLLSSLIFGKKEELEPNEETKQALLEGEADYRAGKLELYDNWQDLIKDIEEGKK